MIRPILLGPQAGPLSAWSEALLFTAARAQLVDEVIRPRLQQGELVLCDRYSDSTLAYQGYGRGIDLKTLRRLQADATGGLAPDLTLLLDLPVEAGLARIPRRAKDRLDRETIAFHQRVYVGYREMAAREPHRWRQVDASRDPDEVASRILELTLEALRTAGIRPVERRSA
jgi:dTMP kinase